MGERLGYGPETPRRPEDEPPKEPVDPGLPRPTPGDDPMVPIPLDPTQPTNPADPIRPGDDVREPDDQEWPVLPGDDAREPEEDLASADVTALGEDLHEFPDGEESPETEVYEDITSDEATEDDAYSAPEDVGSDVDESD